MIEENKPAPKHLQAKDIHEYPSSMVSNSPGFDLIKGIKPKERPEFKFSDYASAVFETSTYGLGYRAAQDSVRTQQDTPEYNVYKDVPDRFLDESYLPYWIDSPNTEETKARIAKLEREERNARFIANYPWSFAGGAITVGLIDPVNWLFPGTRIATAANQAYDAAKALKPITTARYLGQAGYESALLGGAASATQEVLASQTMLTRDIQDSAYSVLSGALFSGALGAIVPAGISAYAMGKAKAQVNNVIAGETPTPTRMPVSDLYALDMGAKAEMETDNVVSAMPKWGKKMMGISPAGKLRNSQSFTANLVATDLASSPFVLNKNIVKNKPTIEAVDEVIAQFRGQARAAARDINKIFMEQQGISEGFAAGIKSRIAEARGKGLGRVKFSEEVNAVMESGKQSVYPSVNAAVERVRAWINPTKESLVELGLLDKKFLSPEFDNYFTRHWLESVITRNHENFKLLTFKWFSEVDAWYKANQELLDPFKKRLEFAQQEFDKANRNLARVVKSKDYQEFQASKNKSLQEFQQMREIGTKRIQEIKQESSGLKKERKSSKNIESIDKKLAKLEKERQELERSLKEVSAGRKSIKSNRFKRMVELEERIAHFKDELEIRREALYENIPHKYLTPGGFIPLGNKTPLELHAAAMQTFYRTTGSDISTFLNPILGGTVGNPNPLQARVFTMPWDFSTTNFKGETIRASDFFSRDIFKMIDNYAGATAGTIAFTRLARARGFKDEAELKQWYLKNIQDEYDALMQGKSGKEAARLAAKKKSDMNNVISLIEQNYGISGKGGDIFGPKFRRFIRRLRTYNSERMLGSAYLSSLTDPFTTPFRQGIFTWAQEWVIPFSRQLVSFQKNKAIKSNKYEINDFGYGIETELGQIAKRFYDNDEILIEKKWWHDIAEPMVNSMGNVFGLNQINDFTQNVAGHVSISKTLRTIAKKAETGKISERDRIRLRKLNISEESEKHIYDMWKEKGGIDKGAFYSNHTEWNVSNDRARAYQEFVYSWQRDISHSQLRSGINEQPAWYQSTMGKMLFHFKDYLIAANSKLLLSGIQKIGMREHEVLLSILLMMGAGQMTYMLNSLAKDPTGESLDLSPHKLFIEGLDRSAFLGLVMEPINMFHRQGWLPGSPVTRYQSRGLLGNWVGPEIGTAQDLADALVQPLINKLKGENYTTKDAMKILRLIPWQNLFYIRYLNEQLTKRTAESFGATPKE